MNVEYLICSKKEGVFHFRRLKYVEDIRKVHTTLMSKLMLAIICKKAFTKKRMPHMKVFDRKTKHYERFFDKVMTISLHPFCGVEFDLRDRTTDIIATCGLDLPSFQSNVEFCMSHAPSCNALWDQVSGLL